MSPHQTCVYLSLCCVMLCTAGVQPSSTTPAGLRPFVQTATQHIRKAASCCNRKARNFPRTAAIARVRPTACQQQCRQASSRHTAAAACNATRAQAAHGSPCRRRVDRHKGSHLANVMCYAATTDTRNQARGVKKQVASTPSRQRTLHSTHTPKMQGTWGMTRTQPLGKPAFVRGGDAQAA